MEEGRGEAAFKAGQVVQGPIEPFVKVLIDSEKGKRCSNCFKASLGLQRCSHCRINHYCNKKCQKADWKFAHSVECKLELFRTPDQVLLGRFRIEPYLSFIVARITAHLKLHPERETEKHGIYDGREISFSDLLSHVDDGDVRLELFAEKMSSLMITDEDSGWNATCVRKLLGIWKTNAFVLEDDQEEKIGGALYLEASVFNHSCRPNAERINRADRCIEIRCIADIPHGAPVLISYLPGNRSRDQRQQDLMRQYNFSCECQLCEEEKSGPVTNYELLKETKRRIFLGGLWSTFEQLVELREQVLNLYKPLFHPYDKRITTFTTRFFTFLFDCGKLKMKGNAGGGGVVQKLADDTLKRLEITLGKESFEYRETVARMNCTGIKVPK